PIGPDVMRVGRFPKEWFQIYLEKKYEFYDPVTKKLFSKDGRDVIWKDLHKMVQRRTKGWRILNECGEFGLRDGITFPLFGAHGYLAGATFAAPKFDTDPDFRSALNLIATYAHARFLYFHRQDRASNKVVEITPREREILQWVASGKSDWEIGEILCISEHTSQKHMENIKHKLGVGKRIQAVVEALRRSLIRA
ncbi:autoinducer binding domain-containing protein, partial [bacterium AH-315-P15]|nr:autoinducer binding domain-containing protein [bacterium AH-315-P15]